MLKTIFWLQHHDIDIEKNWDMMANISKQNEDKSHFFRIACISYQRIFSFWVFLFSKFTKSISKNNFQGVLGDRKENYTI